MGARLKNWRYDQAPFLRSMSECYIHSDLEYRHLQHESDLTGKDFAELLQRLPVAWKHGGLQGAAPHAMPVTIGNGLSFCGHALTEDELELIRRITREFANLTVTELAATLCELLQWRRPNGGSRECYLFLLELQRRGRMPWSPAVQSRRRREPRVKPETSVPSSAAISGPLHEYRPIRLELIKDTEQRRLLRLCIEELPLSRLRGPYGAQLRYWSDPAATSLSAIGLPAVHQRRMEMAPRISTSAGATRHAERNLPL